MIAKFLIASAISAASAATVSVTHKTTKTTTKVHATKTPVKTPTAVKVATPTPVTITYPHGVVYKIAETAPSQITVCGGLCPSSTSNYMCAGAETSFHVTDGLCVNYTVTTACTALTTCGSQAVTAGRSWYKYVGTAGKGKLTTYTNAQCTTGAMDLDLDQTTCNRGARLAPGGFLTASSTVTFASVMTDSARLGVSVLFAAQDLKLKAANPLLVTRVSSSAPSKRRQGTTATPVPVASSTSETITYSASIPANIASANFPVGGDGASDIARAFDQFVTDNKANIAAAAGTEITANGYTAVPGFESSSGSGSAAIIIIIIIIIIILVAIAVAAAVYFLVIRKKQSGAKITTTGGEYAAETA